MQTTDTAKTETSAVWATPVIETYDVAEFTLGAGGNAGDANTSLS